MHVSSAWGAKCAACRACGVQSCCIFLSELPFSLETTSLRQFPSNEYASLTIIPVLFNRTVFGNQVLCYQAHLQSVSEGNQFLRNCRKTNTEVITPTTHKRSKQRDEPIRIPSNYLQLAPSAGKSRVNGAIGLSFASYWLKKPARDFKAIIKCSNHNCVITVDRHLETRPISEIKSNLHDAITGF